MKLDEPFIASLINQKIEKGELQVIGRWVPYGGNSSSSSGSSNNTDIDTIYKRFVPFQPVKLVKCMNGKKLDLINKQHESRYWLQDHIYHKPNEDITSIMPSAYFPTLMLIDTALMYHDGLEITPPYPINLPIVFARKPETVIISELELETDRREKITTQTVPVGATLTIVYSRQVEEREKKEEPSLSVEQEKRQSEESDKLLCDLLHEAENEYSDAAEKDTRLKQYYPYVGMSDKEKADYFKQHAKSWTIEVEEDYESQVANDDGEGYRHKTFERLE